MKIALIGYGKMGRMIESCALAQGHSIVARIQSREWKEREIEDAEICMEFTHPESAVRNIERIVGMQKDLVIGTTGWYDQIGYVENLVGKAEIGALYGPNFSIGIHLFLQIVRQAARLIHPHNQYDVAAMEVHHKGKKDSPSGTALAVAQVIEKEMNKPCSLTAQRCGSVPGTHTVLFDSESDQIVIEHTARSREGFALGALQAAEWVHGRKGLFQFSDIFI